MIVHTVFGHDVDVDQTEADALERAGLVRADGPAPDVPGAEPVTVTPVFTGQPTQVGADEAAALERSGLLLPDDSEPAAQSSYGNANFDYDAPAQPPGEPSNAPAETEQP